MSGMSGMSGMGNAVGPLAAADALTLSRAATVGPFDGATLQVRDPAFDRAANLRLWADPSRLEVLRSELMEGLAYHAHDRTHQALLAFHDDPRRPARLLVTLDGPSMDLLKAQLSLVAAYADLRPDRALEVVEQTGYPLAFWAAVTGLTAHRHGKTLMLLELAFTLCVSAAQRFKHIFAVPRPVAFSPQIQPMIPTPGHGSWPSGHATEAFATAAVLQALLDAAAPARRRPRAAANGDASREQLQRLAARIAINRTVAGLHYPVDSAAGRLLGTALGEFVVARATGGSVHERGFVAARFVGPDGSPLDFDPHAPMDHASGHAYVRSPKAIALPRAPLLAWLWKEALEEWA